jgi:type IV secretory pathway TraG/TraD family ATPase VirD4
MKQEIDIRPDLESWWNLGKIEGQWEKENPHHVTFPKSDWGNIPFLKIGNPFRSFGIFGGAGSGKTESVFKPIIHHAVKSKAGIILYDYKSPELANFLKAQNPELPVYHVNFDDPKRSAKINPIAPQYIKDTLSALELAQSLYFNLNPKAIAGSKDPFWDNSAISIIQATIWYLKEHSPQECNIPVLVELLLRDIRDVLQMLREDEKCRKILASVLAGLDSPNLLASISSTVQNPLSRLIEDDITHIMGEAEAPLEVNDPENPCILILGMNQENPQAYSPLVSLIITSALRRMNQPNKWHSYVILDEAPTIYIPRIEDYPAVTRSRMISFVYGAQDISQVDKAYGKERRQALMTNLGTQFFGRTPNPETIKYVVDLFGKEDRQYKSVSYSNSSGQSTGTNSASSSSNNSESQSFSIQQREVLTPQQILNFPPGEFAFLGTDVNPGQSTQIVISLSQFGRFGERKAIELPKRKTRKTEFRWWWLNFKLKVYSAPWYRRVKQLLKL